MVLPACRVPWSFFRSFAQLLYRASPDTTDPKLGPGRRRCREEVGPVSKLCRYASRVVLVRQLDASEPIGNCQDCGMRHGGFRSTDQTGSEYALRSLADVPPQATSQQ